MGSASSSRPLLLQNVLGYSESRTGLLSIARPLAFAIAGPLAGFVAVRIGERRQRSPAGAPPSSAPWS